MSDLWAHSYLLLILLLVSVLAQSFFTLVRSYFMSFSFFTRWHKKLFYVIKLIHSRDWSITQSPFISNYRLQKSTIIFKFSNNTIYQNGSYHTHYKQLSGSKRFISTIYPCLVDNASCSKLSILLLSGEFSPGQQRILKV